MSLQLTEIIPWTKEENPVRYRAVALELSDTQIILDIICNSWPLLVMNDYLEDRNLYFDFMTSSFRPIHVYTEETPAEHNSPFKWDNRYIVVIKKINGRWRKCIALPDDKRKKRAQKKILIRREKQIPGGYATFALICRFYHTEKDIVDRYLAANTVSYFLTKYLADNHDHDCLRKKKPDIKEIPKIGYPLPPPVILPRRPVVLCWPISFTIPVIRVWAPTPHVEPPETPDSQDGCDTIPGQRPLDSTSF